MIQHLRHKQFPASNPLANALVIIVGILVIVVSFVVGVVAFVALLTAAIVLAAVIGVRVWWLNRKFRTGKKSHMNQRYTASETAEIIEGEFRVITHDKAQKPGD